MGAFALPARLWTDLRWVIGRRKFPFPAQWGDGFDDWVVGLQFVAPPSLHRKFPFPAWRGDWFDDWVLGRQFEPDHLHHPLCVPRTLSGFIER
jgi:hypothetical protein